MTQASQNDLTSMSEADAADYVAGRISLEEYRQRAYERYGLQVKDDSGRVVDPVVVFDAMEEAGTALFGSYIWLKRHAASEVEADRWWEAALAVRPRREAIDARDMSAQRRLMAEFIAEERAVVPLVRV